MADEPCAVTLAFPRSWECVAVVGECLAQRGGSPPMSSFSVSSATRRVIVGGSLAALIAAVALIAAFGAGGSGDELGAGAPATGESDLPAQTFELFDGTEATFADFAGEPLVINFWASWCPSCVAELPEFQAVHEALGDDVQFLGIANADDRARGLDLIEETGVTYQLADDPKGDLFREFGNIAMPTTIFVSADGRIVDSFAGQLNESALVERVEKLLAAS